MIAGDFSFEIVAEFPKFFNPVYAIKNKVKLTDLITHYQSTVPASRKMIIGG